MDLAVTLGRLHLRNPILIASGTFGYAREHGRPSEWDTEYGRACQMARR
jgi:hypothetical protein